MAVRFGFDVRSVGIMCCAPAPPAWHILIDDEIVCDCVWNGRRQNGICRERISWKYGTYEAIEGSILSRKFISKNSKSNSQSRKVDIPHWVFNYFSLSWWMFALNCEANFYFYLQESTSSCAMCAKTECLMNYSTHLSDRRQVLSRKIINNENARW